MKKTALVLFILPLWLISQTVCAGSLSMNNYAEVLVQNLQIGSSYSMIELVNLPLEIVNKSDEAIDIRIEVVKPAKAKKDFEPIPNISWIKIAPEKAAIPAQGTYKTDVKISIPDDSKYLGKKYEVNIRASMVPKAKGMVAIALAVQGRLLFTVAAVKQAQPTGAAKIDMNFNLAPLRVDLKDVKLGKKQEVLVPKDGPVVLQNSGKKEATFVLQSLDPKDTVISIEPEYVAPSADWLTFEKEEMAVGGGQKKPVKMFVEIPNQPEYAGKNFEFIVCVTTGVANAGKRYLRVMVSTAK